MFSFKHFLTVMQLCVFWVGVQISEHIILKTQMRSKVNGEKAALYDKGVVGRVWWVVLLEELCLWVRGEEAVLPAAVCRLGVHGGWAEWKAHSWRRSVEGAGGPQGALGTPSALHRPGSPSSQHSPNTHAQTIKTTPNKHTLNTLTTCVGCEEGSQTQ